MLYIDGVCMCAAGGNEASFLLIAQEEYHEHSRPLVGGLFSNGGQHVATLDTDGVVKSVFLSFLIGSIFQICFLIGWLT